MRRDPHSDSDEAAQLVETKSDSDENCWTVPGKLVNDKKTRIRRRANVKEKGTALPRVSSRQTGGTDNFNPPIPYYLTDSIRLETFISNIDKELHRRSRSHPPAVQSYPLRHRFVDHHHQGQRLWYHKCQHLPVRNKQTGSTSWHKARSVTNTHGFSFWSLSSKFAENLPRETPMPLSLSGLFGGIWSKSFLNSHKHASGADSTSIGSCLIPSASSWRSYQEVIKYLSAILP